MAKISQASQLVTQKAKTIWLHGAQEPMNSAQILS